MNDYPGFARAQAMYEAQTPPDDGPSECPDCNGSGYMPADEDHEDELTCMTCEGYGYLDEDGKPCNPNAAAEAAEERADYERQCKKDGYL